MKKSILSLLIIIAASMVHAQTVVTFYTTKGDFALEIFDDVVPITGGNFLNLVDQKYYDGVIFHRVIDGFMIQGGDGASASTIQDEFDASLSNVQKTISMANAGPNTGSSQFFINLVNNTFLDFNKPPLTSAHPVFGEVIANFNIVQDIGKVTTGAGDKPVVDVVMDSVRRGYGLAVGIQNNFNANFQAWVYPNPVNSTSVLKIHSDKTIEAEIQVFDAQGRIISIRKAEMNQGVNSLSLSSILNSDATGIYHINILVNNKVQQVNVVVP